MWERVCMDSAIDQPKQAMGLISQDSPETEWRACRTSMPGNLSKHQALAFYLKLIDLPWQKKKSKITGRYKQRHQKRPCKVTVEVGFQPGNTHTHCCKRNMVAIFTQFALLSYIIIKYNVSDLCFSIQDFFFFFLITYWMHFSLPIISI